MTRPRSLRTVLLGMLLLGIALVLVLWLREAQRLYVNGGYGNGPGAAGDDELVGAAALEAPDAEPSAPPAATAKELQSNVEIDGQPGKLSTGWYANGNLSYEQRSLDGKPHGKTVYWNEAGQKVSEHHWKNGYLDGTYRRWYGNGLMAEEAGYARFRFQRTRRSWYRNGQEKTRAEYRDGLREGRFIAWYPDGTKYCEATFAQDRLHGTWQKWDSGGKRIKRIEYRAGAPVAVTPAGRAEPFVYPGKLGARDFAFVLAQGSGWHGFNTLRVSADGKCEYRYFFCSGSVSPLGQIYRRQVWRKAVFQLTDDLQRALRDALSAADLFSLADQYANQRIADGTQWEIRLRAEGKEKRIWCSNEFPEPLRQLSRTIRGQILEPHRAELATATRDEEGRKPSEDGWLEDLDR
jgi:antitoxin component YwqK of YwqJK toxin-antitoxin module